MADRAIVFIDGNNWFHALREIGVEDRGRLDYKKISQKLLGPRVWLETRYYIGRMTQEISATLYGEQRSFLAGLTNTDKRISGDYTPAVENVRKLGKKVYAASPMSGAQLGRAVNTFITLPKGWFGDCY